MDYVTVILVLFGLSEALSYIPAIKSNGVFQLVFNILSKLVQIVKDGIQTPTTTQK